MAIILNQFLDNASSIYFIFIEPDAVYKLANIEREKLMQEKKFWYLKNLCIYAILKPILYFQYIN